MVAFLRHHSKNHAHRIKNTHTNIIHIATNGGLAAKPITKPMHKAVQYSLKASSRQGFHLHCSLEAPERVPCLAVRLSHPLLLLLGQTREATQKVGRVDLLRINQRGGGVRPVACTEARMSKPAFRPDEAPKPARSLSLGLDYCLR